MVFTSLPLYLDPPNWNNQQSQQQTGSAHAGNELQTAIQPTPMNGGATGAAPGGGSVRPNSMADRARMAKIPQPEQALKCPRCDSTNTKFCYFNNYSLSQPRHFCKTCRRYWTRGGALRSVPVGGGCRRNKRSKSSKSGSSAANADRQAGGASSSSSSTTTSGSSMMHSSFQHHPQLPFLASLHTLSEYGAPNLGLNFAGMQPIDHSSNYQVGGGGGSGSIGLDQWRIQQLQQFPFLGGLDNSYAAVMTTTASAAAGGVLYNPFDSEQSAADGGFNEEVVLPKATSSALISQLASVKMEDSNPQGLNLARQYLGISGNDQYWGGSGSGGGGITGSSWAPGGDLSGFNCSSSGNVL